MKNNIKMSKKIAILVDGDNSTAKAIGNIVDEMSSHGDVVMVRVYGNWRNGEMKTWVDMVQFYPIRPVQQLNYVKKKNSTDMAMAVDAMEILIRNDIDIFCIVSSDSDFCPLALSLRDNNKRVIVFGGDGSPDYLKNVCTEFKYIDDYISTDVGSEQSRRDKERRNNLKSLIVLVRAVENALDGESWADLSVVGNILKTQYAFHHSEYGYDSLTECLKAMNVFEFARDDDGFVWVRHGLDESVCS